MPLRASKLSWTTSKSAMGGGLVDDRRLKTFSVRLVYPYRPLVLSDWNAYTYTLGISTTYILKDPKREKV